MLNFFKKLFFEPLTHFLLLGFVLYLYYNTLHPTKTIKDRSSYQLSVIPQNLESQLEFYEEILLQEAYRLKLDSEDVQIKEKLLQKMEHILENSQPFVEPTEEELYRYYQAHLEDYSSLESLSFSYLSFSREDDAKLHLKRKIIYAINPNKLASQKELNNLTLESVEKKFGRYFLFKIEHLQRGFWSEPIESQKSVYLVYIKDKNSSQVYNFEEVESEVYDNYKREFLQKIKREAYQTIATRYKER